MAEYTRQELEVIFERWYKGSIIQFNYPGYDSIHGMCDEVAFDGVDVILHINGTRYTCSLESVKDCVKVIRKKDDQKREDTPAPEEARKKNELPGDS